MYINGGSENAIKRKTLKRNQCFATAKRCLFYEISGNGTFFFPFFAFLGSFAQPSSLMLYIVRIFAKHVGKDICLQARINFPRVL